MRVIKETVHALAGPAARRGETTAVRRPEHLSSYPGRHHDRSFTSGGRAPRRRRRPPRPASSDRFAAATSTATLTTFATLPAVEPPTGFAELGVPPRIDDGLAAAGFAQPFKIQTAAIPVAMQGRDVCGRARTGSGKTLAFGVPMLARILERAEPMRPLGLVLVPTRELAVQVAEVLEPVANHADQRILAVYGGASRPYQIDMLREGVEIIVATPLRLIDLLKSDEVSLADVDVVVLDEADRMADDGFTPQVEWILRHCTGRTQTMLFSATLDGDVGHLVRHYLKDPVEVAVDAATDTVGTMHHLFLAVHHMDKDRVIGAISQGAPKVAVFCQTKRLCDKVALARSPTSGSTPPRSTATCPGVPRERAAALRRGPPRRARRHRRGGARPRHRRHQCGRPLRPAEGRQGLPAPIRPHGSCRA